MAALEQKEGLEHEAYRKGEAAFHSKTFMENPAPLSKLPALFGANWKQVRYHNLIRLGGDIERSGLSDYPKATLLGSLLLYAKTFNSA